MASRINQPQQYLKHIHPNSAQRGCFLVTGLDPPKNIPLVYDVQMERVILPYPRFSSHNLPLQIQVLTIPDQFFYALLEAKRRP